jgi:hypothetical protein
VTVAASDPTATDTYVIPTDRVREAIRLLIDRHTHQHFIAYLYLRSLAAREGRFDGLKPSWSELSDWLLVEGGPAGKPHLRPFWKGKRNAGQEWLAENLAGSYSPSSLRKETLRVIQTDAAGEFSLRENHAQLALEHLLLGARIEALALAGFLYRDYGFVGKASPTSDDLIDVFRRDFGYDTEHSAEFDTVYEVTWMGDGPWFELWTDSPI